jgi:uncharacterized protein YdaL
MNIRDQHLKSCKNKAIKFVKSGEIETAISFLEKELNFFKQSKNESTFERFNHFKTKEGQKAKEELIEFIKTLN